jgi:hypothetical protein
MQLKSTLCVAVLAGAAVVGVAFTTQKAEALSVNQVASAFTASTSAKPPMSSGVHSGSFRSFRSFNSYHSFNSYRSYHGYGWYSGYRGWNSYHGYRSYHGYGWYSGYRGYHGYYGYRSYYGYGWYSGYRGYYGVSFGGSMPMSGGSMPVSGGCGCGDMEFRAGGMAR